MGGRASFVCGHGETRNGWVTGLVCDGVCHVLILDRVVRVRRWFLGAARVAASGPASVKRDLLIGLLKAWR